MDDERFTESVPAQVPTYMEAIRYPVADLDGQLVWAHDLVEINERPKGLKCVECQGSLTLRAGVKRRPHFAHHRPDLCAGGETALHSTTIRVITTALEDALRENRPYLYEGACRSCDASLLGDLAQESSSTIEIDRVFSNGIRPDIIVRGSDGVPRVAIEVIVTHAPEGDALTEYDAFGLTVVAVHPTWEALESMREGLLHLSKTATQGAQIELMGRCPFARHLSESDSALRTCSQCDAMARVVTVEVSEGLCWTSRCSQTVRVLDIYALFSGKRELIAAGASDLLGVNEIAKDLGVKVQHRYSKMADTAYLMHACECGAPSGDNFIYGGFGSEQWTPSIAEPIRRYEVCASGHWVQREVRLLRPSTRVGRNQGVRGLIGESANLFGDGPEEQLVAFRSFDTPSEAARFMTRGFC